MSADFPTAPSSLPRGSAQSSWFCVKNNSGNIVDGSSEEPSIRKLIPSQFGFSSRPRWMWMFKKTRGRYWRDRVWTWHWIQSGVQCQGTWGQQVHKSEREVLAGGRKLRWTETAGREGPKMQTAAALWFTSTWRERPPSWWGLWHLRDQPRDWQESQIQTPQLCPSVWPWASHLASIDFCLLIHTLRTIMKTLQSCYNNENLLLNELIQPNDDGEFMHRVLILGY